MENKMVNPPVCPSSLHNKRIELYDYSIATKIRFVSSHQPQENDQMPSATPTINKTQDAETQLLQITIQLKKTPKAVK
jgi:hypothetical protein